MDELKSCEEFVTRTSELNNFDDVDGENERIDTLSLSLNEEPLTARPEQASASENITGAPARGSQTNLPNIECSCETGMVETNNLTTNSGKPNQNNEAVNNMSSNFTPNNLSSNLTSNSFSTRPGTNMAAISRDGNTEPKVPVSSFFENITETDSLEFLPDTGRSDEEIRRVDPNAITIDDTQVKRAAASSKTEITPSRLKLFYPSTTAEGLIHFIKKEMKGVQFVKNTSYLCLGRHEDKDCKAPEGGRCLFLNSGTMSRFYGQIRLKSDDSRVFVLKNVSENKNIEIQCSKGKKRQSMNLSFGQEAELKTNMEVIFHTLKFRVEIRAGDHGAEKFEVEVLPDEDRVPNEPGKQPSPSDISINQGLNRLSMNNSMGNHPHTGQPMAYGYQHSMGQTPMGGSSNGGGYGQVPMGSAYGQVPMGRSYGQVPMGGAYGQVPMGGSYGQIPNGAYGQTPMGGAYGQTPMAGVYGQTPMGGAYGQTPMGGAYGQTPMQAMGGAAAYGQLPMAGSYARPNNQNGLWQSPPYSSVPMSPGLPPPYYPPLPGVGPVQAHTQHGAAFCPSSSEEKRPEYFPFPQTPGGIDHMMPAPNSQTNNNNRNPTENSEKADPVAMLLQKEEYRRPPDKR